MDNSLRLLARFFPSSVLSVSPLGGSHKQPELMKCSCSSREVRQSTVSFGGPALAGPGAIKSSFADGTFSPGP